MDLSVIIPTCRRPDKLAACLRSLGSQTLAAGRYEVLVGIDGEDGETRLAAERTWAGLPIAGDRATLAVLSCPKSGQAAVRNALLELARGRFLVFLNDDVTADPFLLEMHLAAQRRAANRGRPALIVGDAPWRVHHPDTLFQRLVRETSMVFFYDRMHADTGAVDEARDWGFRHAWLINLSAPADLVRSVGGFVVFPSTYGYEDDDLAFRVRERHGTPVHFCPAARVVHDHRLTPASYLERERRLGHAAWGFARASPACARAMFGRDVTTDAELAYAAEFVEREAAAAARLERSFATLDQTPAAAVAGEHADRMLAIVYEQHLLLKRWHWRKGLLSAAGSQPRAANRPAALAV